MMVCGILEGRLEQVAHIGTETGNFIWVAEIDSSFKLKDCSSDVL